ncbi:pentatricopeptide repeat-containing protein At3g29290 isoform X2 [Beta vulgaris subsp. vulgaris]|uniref:pentatricopeptide repeat-containing protein At3g29290 isoform X2 n=1 Tax=Beta vulgaris subsp. vulgaris TaxID=3555 RepID=UPI00203755ED|nr:pentatricopeptide repeat-containing protein At3g29290 isoform X2 [Beta vulgaris subsp. vulgaris]
MVIVADILTNFPGNFVILNGLSCRQCLHNQDNRARYYVVYMNSNALKFQKQTHFHEFNTRIADININFHGLGPRLCHISSFDKPGKTRNSVNFKLMVASVEHGLVSKQGETPFVEDEVEEKQWSFRNLDCGNGSSNCLSLALKEGEMKLYYLEERDEVALSKRILGLSRNNKRTSALQLFRSMEFAGLRADLHACNSLLACLSRKDMVDDMLRVFAIMRRDKILSGHSCSLVLKAVASCHGSDKALQMFDEWEVESEMRNYFDAIVYNTMISICGKENRWVQMERVWKAMKENGNIGTAVTYRILVCTLVRCGQYEIAIDAYAEMLQNGIKPEYDAMQAVIGAYSKEEKWDLALSVFQSMLNYGLKPNLISCNALINSLGKAGKLKEAFKVYKHIRFLGHTPDSYTWNALLSAFYRANQYVNALRFFDSIQRDGSLKPNLQIYNTALMCCQRLGFWDKALKFLWKMEDLEISVSTESYNIAIGACEVARKPKVALQIYEHMVHKKCAPDTFTLLSLIRSCIWGDLWDEVEDILNESTANVSLYNAAIHGMYLRGRVESAKRLYLRMRDIGLVPDGKTRALMLQCMQQKIKLRLLKKSREVHKLIIIEEKRRKAKKTKSDVSTLSWKTLVKTELY